MRTEPSFSAEPDDQLDASLDDSSVEIGSESQLLPDYCQRYGLSMDPFVDDPHFPFYQGAQRRQILEQLIHVCQFSHNLLVVTGGYGVGKTRMAQALIDSLDDGDDICFIEGQITSDMTFLFSEVLVQFELVNETEFTELCSVKSDQDGLVVLIIDNAHHLTDEVITGLINLLEENYESRLHIVMFSEPHLLERMNNIDAPAIVLTDFFLEKFSLAEAVDYLNFRMEVADYLGPEIFTETKVESWWRQSQGQLLVLHDLALAKLSESVSASTTNRAHKSNMLVPHIIATSVLVGVLFFGYLYLSDSEEPTASQATESFPLDGQQKSTANSLNSSMGASSIIASDVATESVLESNSAQISSDADAAIISSTASETPPLPAEVKQTIVPLVETNNSYETVEQQSKTNINSATKEVKTITSANASSKIKAIPKVKNESNGVSVSKVPDVYTAQEKTILSWDESAFTLQIVGLSSEKSALEFISAQSNKKDLLLFRSTRQGKDWYVVVSGHYPNAVSARQASKYLPESQLKATPWPRDLKTIHKEIKQRNK